MIATLVFLLIGFVSVAWTRYPIELIDVGAAMQGPSGTHWLGTDHLGRDLVSLVMKGTLTSFVVAAILTPSADPWNQTVFAVPMIGLYLVSIGIAWIAGPKHDKATSRGTESNVVPLVFAAAVIDQARKRGPLTSNPQPPTSI